MGFQWGARRWLSPALPPKRGLLAPSSGCCPLAPLPCATPEFLGQTWGHPLSPQGTSSPLGDMGWDPVALEKGDGDQSPHCRSDVLRVWGVWGGGSETPRCGAGGYWGAGGQPKGGNPHVPVPKQGWEAGTGFSFLESGAADCINSGISRPCGRREERGREKGKEKKWGGHGAREGVWGSLRSLQLWGSPPLGGCPHPSPCWPRLPGCGHGKGGKKGKRKKISTWKRAALQPGHKAAGKPAGIPPRFQNATVGEFWGKSSPFWCSWKPRAQSSGSALHPGIRPAVGSLQKMGSCYNPHPSFGAVLWCFCIMPMSGGGFTQNIRRVMETKTHGFCLLLF